MSIPFTGFVGNSYQLNSLYAGIERTVNWYLDPVEDPGEEKARAILSPSPGNYAFGPIPSTFPFPARGRFQNRGKVFGVNGGIFFELLSNGTEVQRGSVADDGNPVSFTANGNNQVCCFAGGNLYVWDGATFTTVAAQPPDGPFLGGKIGTFQDGYVITNTPNTNEFQISGNDTTPVGDATIWSALNVSVQAGQADYMTGVISNQEYLYLIGNERSQVYQNVGNSGIGGFPFQSYNDVFLEIGSPAPYSISTMGAMAADTVAMVSKSKDGSYQAWAIAGLRPERISTFAVEQFWASYPTVNDARAFSWQWNGHVFWQITFPSANNGQGATWVYDRTVSLMTRIPCWHERNYTDFNGVQWARSEQYHCFGFGKHLVGSVGIDGNPGVTYQYKAPNDNVTPFCDLGQTAPGGGANGNMPIIRDRIAPHLWGENKWRIYDSIEFEGARGVGLDGLSVGVPGYDPVITLRWSNDYGATFGAEFYIKMGKIGQDTLRMIQRRTGRARDRVFWVRVSDPVFSSFSNAMLDIRQLAV